MKSGQEGSSETIMRVVEISTPASYHTAMWIKELLRRGIDARVVYVKDWDPSKTDRVAKIEGCTEVLFQLPKKSNIFGNQIIRGRIGSILRDIRYRTTLNMHLDYFGTKLRKYCETNEVDVVHAHGLHYGALLANASGYLPAVISTWGSDVAIAPHKYPHYLPLMKKTLQWAPVVHVMSEVSLNLVRRIYPVEDERIIQSTWGVDTDLFKPDLDYQQLRDDLKIPDGPVILSFRNLEPFYRVDIIIKAFHMISDKYPSATLVVGGYGSEREALERLVSELNISNRVVFTGVIESENLQQLYALADIYIQCPPSDGVALSSMQALASGLPIVTNNVGEVGAVVEPERNGIFVEDGDDPSSYAETLDRLLQDEDLRFRMSKEARETAVTK
ncbi:MAG: glycosyltransferase, partial [Candidatus Thorarchaeota archaeon]